MATAWRTSPQPLLETQPWKLLCIEGKTYLVKGLFTSDSYNILVTDLGTIWEESITEHYLLQKSKSLNPYIEAPSSIILQQLSSRLLEGPLSSCTYTITYNSDQLIISIIGPLQHKTGPQYQWNFNLSKAPPLVLKHQLVSSLLSVSVELLRQQKELVSIINKKDKEIKDYKDNGAVISRSNERRGISWITSFATLEHIETIPFEEKAFYNEMILSKEFQSSVVDPLACLDNMSFQELYRDISLCNHWTSNRDDSVISVSDIAPSASTGTWEGKLPTSLTGTSPTKSPVKSPRKRPLEESPSKDVEKSRRIDLEKQLEESKAKNKKKKKKLM